MYVCYVCLLYVYACCISVRFLYVYVLCLFSCLFVVCMFIICCMYVYCLLYVCLLFVVCMFLVFVCVSFVSVKCMCMYVCCMFIFSVCLCLLNVCVLNVCLLFVYCIFLFVVFVCAPCMYVCTLSFVESVFKYLNPWKYFFISTILWNKIYKVTVLYFISFSKFFNSQFVPRNIQEGNSRGETGGKRNSRRRGGKTGVKYKGWLFLLKKRWRKKGSGEGG